MTNQELSKKANDIRKDIIEQVHAAKSGHPGGSLSSAEILSVLYFKEMNIDPQNPEDPGRDRFVLSKGHASPALYGVLAERGYFPKDELKSFRQIGSHLQGHPCMNLTPGVDASSGSLGQGVSIACGMALGAKVAGDDFRVYSLLGDGEIQEGQVWEAAMFAGSNHLDNLCLMIDNNGLQIDGKIEEVNSPYPIDAKFEAFGFHVINVEDGHDIQALIDALDEARATKDVPTAIIMKTIKGKGVSFMENAVSWHGKGPNDEEYEIAMKDLEQLEEA